MFDDLEDLEEDFIGMFAKNVAAARVDIPGRTTYRHTSSGRRYVVTSATGQSVKMESISGHVRDLHPDTLHQSDMWELVTA